jgi:hypothetical protein
MVRRMARQIRKVMNRALERFGPEPVSVVARRFLAKAKSRDDRFVLITRKEIR